MKLVKLFFITILIFASNFSNAQISESERSMVMGVKNAIILDIPDTDDKLVEKLWKSYMKDAGGKVKKVKKADETMAEGVKLVDIGGSDPVNVYSRTDNAGNDAEHIVWFDLGNSFLTSGDGGKYQEAEKFMMGFGLYVTKAKIQMELDAEEKKMKGLQGDMKKLKKDNDNYHKQIEKAKELIAKMEANIEQNVKDQESKTKEITVQDGVIEAVKKRLKDID